MAYIKVTILPVIIDKNKTNNVWWNYCEITEVSIGIIGLQVDLHMYIELCGNEA